MPTTDASALASELRTVLGLVVRRLRAERRSFSLAQGAVLSRLDREGPQSISGLAAAERVRPQSMASTLSELGRDGLTARRPDPADGRSVLVEITARGRAALEAERRYREGWLAEAIAGDLSAHERAVLAEAVVVLARIADA
jgi:DNA-binding MarR family transcriptional regulator